MTTTTITTIPSLTTTTATDDEFRASVRTFLQTTLPKLDATGTRDTFQDWIGWRADSRLIGITVPTELGGAGLERRHQHIWDEEARDANAPGYGPFGLGFSQVVNGLLQHGTTAQQHRWIPPVLRGEHQWCQLWSEPSAGSDLASLRTTARRDGDEYIVNGQKVWTSGAMESQWGLALVRTDPDLPSRAGLSVMFIDMSLPGVTVRPLRQMTGVSEFNEVFFDDVRVSADCMLGAENDGWSITSSMIGAERSSIGATAGGGGRRPIPSSALIDLARETGQDRDPLVRQGLADLYAREQVAAWLDQRNASRRAAGSLPPAADSLGKLWRSILGRTAAALAHRVALGGGAAWEAGDERGDWSYRVLDACALSLGGGTDEIQRNALGERYLGLPREPRVTVPTQDRT